MRGWSEQQEAEIRESEIPHRPISCGNTTAFSRQRPWIAELLAWRGVAFTSLLTALAWWLLVAICMSDDGGIFRAPRFQLADSSSLFSKADDGLCRKFVSGSWLSQLSQCSDSSVVLADPPLRAATNELVPLWPVGTTSDGIAGSVATAEFHSTEPLFRGGVDEYRGSGPGWEVLPSGLLYRSYLAGIKESRIQYTSFYETREGRNLSEAALGGRGGLLRYGSFGGDDTDAFQIDVEGAVFARVLPDQPSSDLEGADFRIGTIATWRRGPTAFKAGYYHISSHVGDEFLLSHPGFIRINYVRDSLIVGVIHNVTESTQIYAEIGDSIGIQGGAKPLEIQFGAQYLPAAASVRRGAPFAAINGHLRQEFDFSGSVNAMVGWGWEGLESRRRFRIGVQVYDGPSMQYSFFDKHETLIGGGAWFDF